MASFKKSDLTLTYSWTVIDGDDPRITGTLDSTRFSRNEGYEVLYFINAMASTLSITTKNAVAKLEKLINEKLPSDIQSQNKVKEWVIKNW